MKSRPLDDAFAGRRRAAGASTSGCSAIRAAPARGTGAELAAEARGLVRGARPAVGLSPARPRRWRWTPTAIRIDGVSFASARLAPVRWCDAGADSVVLVAVSAGPEIEAEAQRRWLDEKPDEYFFLEIYGSAVVEHLVTKAGARLCAWAEAQGLAVLPHYSPGYPEWDIAEQAALLELLTAAETPLPSALEVLDSGMLRPKKSLLAVFGLTPPRRPRPAADGPGAVRELLVRAVPVPPGAVSARRAAVDGADVRRARPGGCRRRARAGSRRGLHSQREGAAPLGGRAADADAARRRHDRRALPLRRHDLQQHGPAAALRLSRQARAAARGLPDSRAALRAGRRRRRPHVHVPLHEQRRAPDGRDRARSARSPASRSTTCSPGQRPAAGAGCYCEPTSRKHKWGLVLETIHYALASSRSRRRPESA